MNDTRSERLILTAAAKTTDQTSAVFVVPRASKQFALAVDVTIGAAIDLKITLQTRIEEIDMWVDMVVGVPLVAISGVSKTAALFGSATVDTDMDTANVSIRGQMRAIVVHGNSVEVTYTVHLKPL